ncbi:hypothetical protein [Moorella sulfitireducens (nom. illeg.)]|uniref:hypothetical protein n=1 Tax=Neomoorella sulfitireducens TaxID=2972948 RepID=UPI0021ABEC81|nr:hypothetical protein [Moorella sulfitireducens]
MPGRYAGLDREEDRPRTPGGGRGRWYHGSERLSGMGCDAAQVGRERRYRGRTGPQASRRAPGNPAVPRKPQNYQKACFFTPLRDKTPHHPAVGGKKVT